MQWIIEKYPEGFRHRYDSFLDYNSTPAEKNKRQKMKDDLRDKGKVGQKELKSIELGQAFS